MHDPPCILVVDDNETNRDILVTRLEAHGYQTLQAADGEEALRGVTQHRPDVVLLDVMMPNLDGLEACRRLKSDRAVTFTPVILVTAKAATQDIVAGLDAGADEYLTKPVDQAALVARTGAGASGRSRQLESDACPACRGTGCRNRAHWALETFPCSASCATCIVRRRTRARKSSARSNHRLLRLA